MDSKVKSTFRKHYCALLSVCIGITVSLSMHCYVTPENPKSNFLNTSYSLVLCTQAASLTPVYLVKVQPVVQNVVRRLQIKALLDFRKRANR